MSFLIKFTATAIAAYISVITFAASASLIPKISVAVVSALLFSTICRTAVFLYNILCNVYSVNYLWRLVNLSGEQNSTEFANDIVSVAKDYKPVFKLYDNVGWGMAYEPPIEESSEASDINISIYAVSKEGERHRICNARCESFGYIIATDSSNLKRAEISLVHYGELSLKTKAVNIVNSDFIEVVISNKTKTKKIDLFLSSNDLGNLIMAISNKKTLPRGNNSYPYISGLISR